MAALDNLKLYRLAKSIADGLVPVLRNNAVMPKLIKTVKNNIQIPLQGATTAGTRNVGSVAATPQLPSETKVNFRITSDAEIVYPVDEINAISVDGMDLVEWQRGEIISTLADAVDSAIWALYSSVTTSTVGQQATTPDLNVLAQAKKALKNQKVLFSDPSKIHCVVGAEEEAAWTTAMRQDTQGGLLTSQAKLEGSIASAYGFNIWCDQNRATSADTAFNLCFHEDFAGIAFADTLPHHSSVAQSQATDPESGITVFVQEWPMSESTYGVGAKYRFVIPYAVGIIDETRACVMYGASA